MQNQLKLIGEEVTIKQVEQTHLATGQKKTSCINNYCDENEVGTSKVKQTFNKQLTWYNDVSQ